MTCECMREPDPGVCEGPCSLPSTGHCRCLTGCDNYAVARTVEEWQIELERTEGDLAVAVAEAQRLREFTQWVASQGHAPAAWGRFVNAACAALAAPVQPEEQP